MLEFIKSFKITYEIYNFFKKSALEHNLPLYQKYGLKKKYYSSVSSEDFKQTNGEQLIHDKLDSTQSLPEKEEFNSLDPDTQSRLLNWSKDGYAVLPTFYSSEEIEAFNQEVDDLIDSKKANWRYGRILFSIFQSKLLFDTGNAKRLTSILDLLMGKEVDLFQSLNFVNASQQKSHSDSIHMTTFPYGNLIAVWIALEDITLDNGPLHYYPGSHKLPYVMNGDYDNVGSKYRLGTKSYGDYENKVQEVIAGNDLQKKVFTAKKGDLLIWHANLLHGGEAIINKEMTRKSMVFHYYTKDAICYHEITQRPTLKSRSSSF